jgi:hypothetical protein
MPDVTFTGHSADLDAVLTHCAVTFRSNKKKYAEDDTKAAYLASTFRGPALKWLTHQFTADEDILEKYDDFVSSVRAAFQASLAVQKQTAQRQLSDLRQKSSALDYTLHFEPLADLLDLDDEQRQAAYKAGLKTEVGKQIIGMRFPAYDNLRATAIDVDETLYAMRPHRRRKGRGPSKPSAGKDKRLTAT